MNIIHIISDTFRRDNLDVYGGKGYCPALNAFAEKCIVFNKAYITSFPTVPIRGDLVTGEVGICRRGWEPSSTQCTCHSKPTHSSWCCKYDDR